jgi:hypothetical protein
MISCATAERRFDLRGDWYLRRCCPDERNGRTDSALIMIFPFSAHNAWCRLNFNLFNGSRATITWRNTYASSKSEH